MATGPHYRDADRTTHTLAASSLRRTVGCGDAVRRPGGSDGLHQHLIQLQIPRLDPPARVSMIEERREDREGSALASWGGRVPSGSSASCPLTDGVEPICSSVLAASLSLARCFVDNFR